MNYQVPPISLTFEISMKEKKIKVFCHMKRLLWARLKNSHLAAKENNTSTESKYLYPRVKQTSPQTADTSKQPSRPATGLQWGDVLSGMISPKPCPIVQLQDMQETHLLYLSSARHQKARLHCT